MGQGAGVETSRASALLVTLDLVGIDAIFRGPFARDRREIQARTRADRLCSSHTHSDRSSGGR